MKSILKKISFIVLFSSFIACSSDNSSTNSSTPSLIGKWAFGPTRTCGLRNYVEYKPNNIFIENHCSTDCVYTPYPDEYQLIGNNQIKFFGSYVKNIVELTPSKLVLFDPNINETKTYDRIN